MALEILYGTCYAWGISATGADINTPNFFQGDTWSEPWNAIFRRHPLPPDSDLLFDGTPVVTPRKGPWPTAHGQPVNPNTPTTSLVGNEIGHIELPADGIFEAAGFCNGLIGYGQPPQSAISSWSGSFQFYILKNGIPLMGVFGATIAGVGSNGQWEFPSGAVTIDDNGNEVGYSPFSNHPSVRFEGEAGDSITFQLVNNVEVTDLSVPGRETGLRLFTAVAQVLWLIDEDEPPPPPPPPPPCEIDNHVLTGNESEANIFKHWDNNGVFVESINFSSHIDVPEAWPIGFTQYGASIYTLVTDFNGYHVVLEYDDGLSFLRRTERVLLASDPNQNPEGRPPSLFRASDIDMDDQGSIYIGCLDGSYRTMLFKYDNDGNFLEIITTEASSPATPLWNVVDSSQSIYLNDIKYNETGVLDDTRTVIVQRFLNTGIRTDSIEIHTNSDSPAPSYGASPQERKGSFDCDSNFYVGVADQTSLGPPSSYRPHIYILSNDHPTTPLVHLTPALSPTLQQFPRAVRPNSDASLLWVKVWGESQDKTYMLQLDAADGSLIISPIEIAPTRDLNAEVFVYNCAPCGEEPPPPPSEIGFQRRNQTNLMA